MSVTPNGSRSTLVVTIVAGLTACAVLGVALRIPFAPEREIYVCRASGYLALAVLSLSLCVTPVARLLTWLGMSLEPRGTATLRRAVGMNAAALATLHGSVVFALYGGVELLPLLASHPFYRSGGLTLLLLLVLWLTSFRGWVRRLRIRRWRALHVLAYVALGLAWQHVLLASMSPVAWVVGGFCCVAVVGLLRLLPGRPATAKVVVRP